MPCDGAIRDAAEGLKFTPIEGTAVAAATHPHCDRCRHKRDGSCNTLCKDIKGIMVGDRSGSSRKEYTNEFDLDGHTKTSPPRPGPDYSKFIEEAYIFTARQLEALQRLHKGMTRSEVAQELGITESAVSQLMKRVRRLYFEHQAAMRALSAMKLKQLGDPQLE